MNFLKEKMGKYRLALIKRRKRNWLHESSNLSFPTFCLIFNFPTLVTIYTKTMKIVKPIPNRCYLACSGGIDSMVMLDFLLSGRKEVSVLHVNHGTSYGQVANLFLNRFCNQRNIQIWNVTLPPAPNLGKEGWWHKKRYEFFRQFSSFPILMSHHLDDQVENYLMRGDLINYRTGNIIRPFVRVKKVDIENYAKQKRVQYVTDQSNFNPNYCTRNRIRNRVVPELKKAGSPIYRLVDDLVLKNIG
jgi:tRNA(Ile)-lysidine synthetase-like protein